MKRRRKANAEKLNLYLAGDVKTLLLQRAAEKNKSASDYVTDLVQGSSDMRDTPSDRSTSTTHPVNYRPRRRK